MPSAPSFHRYRLPPADAAFGDDKACKDFNDREEYENGEQK